MNKYLALFIAAMLSAAPPILVKMYVDSGETNKNYLFLSLIVSVLLLIVYIGLVKQYGASIMYTIVKILSILIVVLIGFLYLNEKLNSKQLIGIILAIAALYLLTSE